MSISLAFLSLVFATAPNSDLTESDVTPFQEEVAAEAPRWVGSVLLGLTQTDGNTHNLSTSVTADAVKELEDSRYSLHGFYSKVKVNGETTDRKIGATGQYDYLAGERYYYFGRVGVEKNDLANLDLRYLAGGGVGYEFYDQEKFTLDGEAGLTYFAEEFSDGSDADSISAILGYDLGYIISEQTRLTQSLDAYPPLDEPSDVFLRLDTRLETSLSENMLGSIQYVLDWDNSPAAGAKRDDHRLVINVGWGFGR